MMEEVRSMRDPRMFPGIAILAAARAFDVPESMVVGKGRSQPFVTARQVAMWLLMDVCGWSSPVVGKVMGRNHGTVLHAWKVVQDRIETDPDARERCTLARGLFWRVTQSEKP